MFVGAHTVNRISRQHHSRTYRRSELLIASAAVTAAAAALEPAEGIDDC